jgi:tRNA(Ile)-lysidine synthase TilS/MesJ
MSAFIPIRFAESSGPSPKQKEAVLLARLAENASLIIALSGGADSAYLAWAAQRALD